ncbi:hypothetical protein A8A01_16865 [Ewingella americana]|nr:hypothetical protein A8A01_16865 [Ewingella americana]
MVMWMCVLYLQLTPPFIFYRREAVLPNSLRKVFPEKREERRGGVFSGKTRKLSVTKNYRKNLLVLLRAINLATLMDDVNITNRHLQRL